MSEDTSSQQVNPHDKPCTLCSKPRSVLVRCQIDESGKWHFLCPGKCWKSVSGGEIDAKGHETEFPHYRYGGMWKNRHEDGPLNAKKPKAKKKQKQKQNRQRKERDHGDANDNNNDDDNTDDDNTDEGVSLDGMTTDEDVTKNH